MVKVVEVESASSKKPRKQSETTEDEVEEVEDDDEEEEGGEEEYEIERIMDHREGAVEEGKLAFYVKWKGYDDNENSWVNEDDAGGAQELINAYWARQNKALKGKPKTPAKGPRKSLVSRSPEVASSSTAAKKRGRPSVSKKPDSEEEEASEEEEPTSKKPRKSNGNQSASATKPRKYGGAGKSASAKKQPVDEDVEMDDAEEEELKVGSMTKYLKEKSWEELIDNVDTVERSGDDLLVYFSIYKSNERYMEKSDLCRKKFPQKLITFYEKNLRWKMEDGEQDS